MKLRQARAGRPPRKMVAHFLVVALVSLGLVVVPAGSQVSPAQAVTAGTCSEASGTMICNVQGRSLNFSSLTGSGDSRSAAGIFSDGTVTVNANLTITQAVSASLSGSGSGLSTSISTNATMAFRIDFVQANGSPVLLQNVEVLVTDIDGGTQNEGAEFSGIASYTLANVTELTPSPAGIPSPDAETGTRVFTGNRTNEAATTRNVAVLFAEVGSIGLKAFSTGSGGVVGFQFGPPNWSGVATTTTPVGSGTYTITYDANGGEGAVPAPSSGAGDQTLALGTGLTKGSPPINISSWNTAQNGSGLRLSLGATYRPIANLTLYAQYETQTVTFDGNGADVGSTMANQEAAGPTSLSLNTHVRDGFRFVGWNTAANGSGTAYADGAEFPFSVNRTLFAQWSRNLLCGNLESFDADDFRLLGNASLSGAKVSLTPNLGNQAGAVWSQGRINLTSDFCVSAEVYLGANDAGADGMALVLQSVNSNSLSSGGGLGYAGLNPSFAVEIDTFINTGDPSGDHIALMKNGNTAVHNPWGVEPVVLSNVEDGQWRLLTYEWDASEQESTVYLDGTAMFTSVSTDLVDYFTSSSGTVFWGFTAATGGSTNLQEVRNIAYSATARTNTAPQFLNSPSNQTVLRGSTTEIVVGLVDDSTTQAQWDLSVDVSNSDIFGSAPTFSATSASSGTVTLEADAEELGSSIVTLTATDADGVSVVRTFTLTVATTLPPPAVVGTTPPAVVNPPAVIVPPPVAPRVLPQLTTPLPPAAGPVLRNNQAPTPQAQPTATVGGRPATIQTQVTDPNNVNLRAGVLSLGLSLPPNQGTVRQGTGGATEVEVPRGGSTSMQGSGLLPGSTVQVFLPFGGSDSREIARIPVSQTGTFSGDAVFGATPTERPLPIGRHVLQVVTIDENREQAVVEMTINIAQPTPTPEINRIQGVIPTLRPGQSVATNAGEPELVTVTPNSEQGTATVQGDGWTLAVQVDGGAGGVEPGADGGAAVTFVRGQGASVSGEGFMPGTRADVWLFSEPTLLGSVQIDESGAFNGVVNIDGNVVTVGEHTLQLQGVGEDGLVRAANLGVSVEDEAAAATTEEAASFLWVIWLLAALGVVALGAGGTWWFRRATR